ncbi:hypothetical protein [Paenibacillus glycanilyticus]|uniref:hypothetical protein n=1 Tax=Paenibacillus glycanilyticus TaxID=126569 RepID=UPI00190FE090|nr:hypothetical protein [Paenibacillus glycanilyticus]
MNNHIPPVLGEKQLTDIKPRDIENLYMDLQSSGRLSGENIQKVHTIINESLNKATQWDMLPKNPASAVDRPKAELKEILDR